MMKITATAATPYSAVELDPVDDVLMTVVVDVVVDVPPPPGAVTVVVDVEVVVDTVVDTLVDTLVDAVWTLARLRATMSPDVVPGHVATASKLQVPTGTRRYSWPLTDAPIVTPWSIGAPT
jgi:hypothetical protein